MKHNHLFVQKIIALGLSLLLLTGCSMVPFQTPEEQRAAQEAAQAARLEAQEQADPQDALKTDLQLHRILQNSAGTVLADYLVTFPYFSSTDKKAQSFARINEYYQSELTGLEQDADSFFADVRAAYGESWDTAAQADKPFSVTIDYELLEAPAGYLCVRCDFQVVNDGQSETYSKAQVFLLDNGWLLDLETLLGQGYADAAPRLLSAILRWCRDQQIDVTSADTRTLEEFSRDFALTSDGFVFYTQPFQLNNKDPNRYSIPVSLTGYQDLLELQ